MRYALQADKFGPVVLCYQGANPHEIPLSIPLVADNRHFIEFIRDAMNDVPVTAADGTSWTHPAVQLAKL